MQTPVPHSSGLPLLPSGNPPTPLELALARTPARVLVGRAGAAYRTSTALKLREDHAAARDAVQTEIDLRRDFGDELIDCFELFEVQTLAASKAEYLRRPDLRRNSQKVRELRSRTLAPRRPTCRSSSATGYRPLPWPPKCRPARAA